MLEQSNCFLFTEDGHLITFNGEVFTKVKSPIPGLKGAVPFKDFLNLISKFPDEKLDISQVGEEIRVAGQNRKAGLATILEIKTPFEDVPGARKMSPIPPELMGALVQASHVCGNDENKPFTTAVHVTPKMVEACDNFRLFRTTMATGIKVDLVIPAAGIRAVSGVSFAKASCYKGWLHLKTRRNHLVSLRCMADGGFPNLDSALEVTDPVIVKMPDGLKEIIGRAEVMQDSSLGQDALVSVTIDKGSFAIKTSKDGGWFRETQKIRYKGQKLTFQVHPKFLNEIVAKASKVEVDKHRMRIKEDGSIFLVCLEVD